MSEKNVQGLEIQEAGQSQRIWLVRHGLTDWNTDQRFCGQSDIPLSDTGQRQAHWLARVLHPVHLKALYTSDLRRALETAEYIARSQGHTPPLQTQPAWRELDFGAWEGLTYAEIATRFPASVGFFTDPEHVAPPDGETLARLRQRVLEAFLQIIAICKSGDPGDVLIVSHGGPLRLLLGTILGLPAERQWQLVPDPGSLSVLDLWLESATTLPPGRLALFNLQRGSPFRRALATSNVHKDTTNHDT